ncbi:MAG: PAS domain S-box protein [Deltaproteobacteria bacterium]|nr:PAS domain S-box protein [Deltaproteobacteria bacterium]
MSDVASPDTAAANARPAHEAALVLGAARAQIAAVLAQLATQPDAIVEILGAAREALIAFDQDRAIVFANAAAEALFGAAPGGLHGISTDALVPARFRQPRAAPLTSRPDLLQVDMPALRTDGTEIAVEWVFGSVVVGDAPLFVTTVRERAVMERALDALRASEARFRLLVDGVRDYAIFMLDATGHVTSWNRGAQRTKGYSYEEAIGQSYEIFFTPEDRALGEPARQLAAAAREGNHETTSWRVRKDGTRFRANAQLTALRSPTGELQGFAKITRDLTERLRAQELAHQLVVEQAARAAAEAAEHRLRASEDRLRRLQRITAALSEARTPTEVAAVVLEHGLSALEASAGALYVLAEDGAALEILDQRGHPSLGAFARLELDRRAPLVDAARERTPGFYESFEQCAARYPALRDAIGAGGFEASVALPLLTHGTVIGVLGIRFSDARPFSPVERSLLITLSELCAQALERARLFTAERAARTAAEAANRAKDEFLAMLGHELRNPLAPMVTALSLMKARDGEASQRERTVIERQVTHLGRLIDDLLDVSRITEGKVQLRRERVELAVIVQRAVELASPLLEQRDHHLLVDVAATGLAVFGDPTRLAQVVSNLIGNAAKYTPRGGHIEVVARREGARAVLTVRDDGVGIAREMLPHVFDLFAQERQSVDRAQGGLGLGLAIVKSLIAMHDGTVVAASEGHGKGSTFTVELAALDADTAEPAPHAAEGDATRAGAGRRVLVVDDNPDAADMLAEVLRARGHAAAVAYDAPAALALVARFRPDVALLDLGLPVVDGYELARRLREVAGPVRLVAVTGYGQPADRERSEAAGFDAHMVKPVDLAALFAALL